MKCNPEERILRRLHAAGSAFEIASCTELQLLASLGVRAEDLIFSNPIKPWKQIQEAARAGVWRFENVVRPTSEKQVARRVRTGCLRLPENRGASRH